MYEAHRVNGVQGHDNLGRVELGPLLWDVVVAHQVDDVAAGHVVHHHVQVALVLERIVQLAKTTTLMLNILFMDPRIKIDSKFTPWSGFFETSELCFGLHLQVLITHWCLLASGPDMFQQICSKVSKLTINGFWQMKLGMCTLFRK